MNNTTTTWQPQAHFASNTTSTTPQWLLDSGASHHVTADLSNLSLHTPYNGSDDIMIGDGSSLPITHTGSTSFTTHNTSFKLDNVLCVPSMKKNLISISQFCTSNNVSVEFLPSSFYVKELRTGAILLKGQTKDGVYEWPVPSSLSSPLVAFSSVKTSSSAWHHRLGHPAFSILQHIISHYQLDLSSSLISDFLCNACHCNKSHKLPFSTSTIVSSQPLEIIFTDVWTSPILSHDGFKYYVIFVDHFTKYIWFYPLKHKSEVKDVFIRFKAIVETHFQNKIHTLYSDNGGEYIALRTFLATHGITHLTTPPHTPEHNGYSERRHRHIVETGLTLLSHASLPLMFWTHAFATAVYLINRMPTPTLNLSSPYECIFGSLPNYSKLKIFGSLCYPWLRPYTSHKLESRSKPCIFLGYSLTQSAYLCYHPPTSKMYVSRHVKFVESIFPSFKSNMQPVNPQPATVSTWIPPIIIVPTNQAATGTFNTPSTVQPQGQPSCDASFLTTNTAPHLPHEPPVQPTIVIPSPDIQPTTSVLSSNTQQNTSIPVHKPTSQPPPLNSITTRAKNNIRKPIQKLNLSIQLSHPIDVEPTTVTQALKDPKWRCAISEEYDALVQNGTWELVPSDSSHNIVGCKWIFRTKRHSDGSIDRYKARLVAKGFHQRSGVDYHDTFSPVVKPTTIRLVLSLAVTRGWSLRQLDVNNAFLQGHLSDNVYMSQPLGFIDLDHPTHVCKLQKAIYGLKQAPRAWYHELRKFLIASGFHNAHADTSLFILNTGGNLLYLLVYVDDIILTGNNDTTVQKFIQLLSHRFSLKDLGNLSYFLGVEVFPNDHGILLSQRRYIVDLLTRTKMMDAKPVHTPLPTSPPITLHSGSPLKDPTEYRAIVGSLQYLLITRPDIAFAVNKLSQYMHQPTTEHWILVKRLLRYLCGSSSDGIQLYHDSPLSLHAFADANPLSLHAFSDSDWAGNKDDFTSTSAYIVYIGRNPISWSSKKQRTVARSSTEAEYRSVAATAAELNWISSLLTELRIALPQTPVIYCDNIGATNLCSNPVFHSRMKHVAIDFHFIREQVQNGILRVSHVSSDDQLADALTKPLPKSRFLSLKSKIGLVTRPQS
jgi:histone deacetylase 1/2